MTRTVCACMLSKVVIAKSEAKATNYDMIIQQLAHNIPYGRIFWWFGGFESNPPMFHPPKKLHSVMSSLLQNHSFHVY